MSLRAALALSRRGGALACPHDLFYLEWTEEGQGGDIIAHLEGLWDRTMGKQSGSGLVASMPSPLSWGLRGIMGLPQGWDLRMSSWLRRRLIEVRLGEWMVAV